MKCILSGLGNCRIPGPAATRCDHHKSSTYMPMIRAADLDSGLAGILNFVVDGPT